MELTKIQALTAEIEPYAPSKLSMMKALSDVGVSDTETPYKATMWICCASVSRLFAVKTVWTWKISMKYQQLLTALICGRL